MIKKTTHFFFFIGLAIALLLVSACTFTVNKNQSAEFKINMDSVEKRLDSLIKFEDFLVKGTEKKTNGVGTTIFEIRIINATNIPSDKKEERILAKKIALLFKQSLKEEKDFDTFRVYFVEHQKKGIMTILFPGHSNQRNLNKTT
jgi:hypothetical protein